MGVRADIATVIAEAIAVDWPAVQVYGHPEDITQVPALVLVPDDPWCEPAHFGGGRSGVVRWNFQLAIVTHRAPVESSIEFMESVRTLVEAGIGQLGGQWSALGKPDTTEIAGSMQLMAVMDLHLLTERQT
jgi:hypothetical protein